MTAASLLVLLGPIVRLVDLLAELHGERDAQAAVEAEVRRLQRLKRTKAWAQEKLDRRRAAMKRGAGR